MCIKHIINQCMIDYWHFYGTASSILLLAVWSTHFYFNGFISQAIFFQDISWFCKIPGHFCLFTAVHHTWLSPLINSDYLNLNSQLLFVLLITQKKHFPIKLPMLTSTLFYQLIFTMSRHSKYLIWVPTWNTYSE